MLNRKIQPDNLEIKKINIVKPIISNLPNGVPIYLFRNETNIVSIQIIFKSGSSDQDFPLQSSFTAKMLTEGSHSFSSKKIAETIDFYGARLNAESSKDSTNITLISNLKYWKKLLFLLSDISLHPTFSEKELKTALNITEQHFNIEREKVNTLAKNKFDEVLFGNNNFYGYALKNEDFNNLKTQHLLSFHKTFYTSNNCAVIITGNINDHDLIEFNSFFSDLKTNENFMHKNVHITSNKIKSHHTNKKGAVQSAIKIGGICCQRNSPDDVPLRVLNTVLGGYFGSRLMSNLREEKGYTYGINSSVISLRKVAYFVISSQVGKKVLTDAAKQVFNEIDYLQNNKVSEGELMLVKNYMLGTLLKYSDGHLNLSNLLASLIPYDLDFNYINNYIKGIQYVTPEKLLSVSQKYYKSDLLYKVTAG